MTDDDLRRCFEGAIPAVIATAAADGTPNVTYLSRIRFVDDDRVALSNQFLSKTARNLVENPRASLIVTDPDTFDEYRLSIVYERSERDGSVFEQLRDDVDAVAALSGMEDVFRLRSADVYRVVHREAVRNPRGGENTGPSAPPPVRPAGALGLAELSGRLGRCPDLDALVAATVNGLADLLGYDHTLLMLLDESGSQLYTIASRGYPDEGVGSEVTVGEGLIGMAAARCAPMRIGNLGQMHKYGRSVRRSYEDHADIGPGHDIPVPGLPDAESRVAVPAMARGGLIGVLMVESRRAVAFTPEDEAILTIVASLVANAIAVERSESPSGGASDAAGVSSPAAAASGTDAATLVRFFPVDGSTFLDGDYLIKGVAGRILWSLLSEHRATGRTDFTNKEVRLDPTLELPELRDNLESRLILLKRRLEERGAPIRLEKSGRGRFSLVVEGGMRLESIGGAGA